MQFCHFSLRTTCSERLTNLSSKSKSAVQVYADLKTVPGRADPGLSNICHGLAQLLEHNSWDMVRTMKPQFYTLFGCSLHTSWWTGGCQSESQRTFSIRRWVEQKKPRSNRLRFSEVRYSQKGGGNLVWHKCAVVQPGALKWLVAPKRAGGFKKIFCTCTCLEYPSTLHDYQANRLPPPNTTLCFLEIIAIKRQNTSQFHINNWKMYHSVDWSCKKSISFTCCCSILNTHFNGLSFYWEVCCEANAWLHSYPLSETDG